MKILPLFVIAGFFMWVYGMAKRKMYDHYGLSWWQWMLLGVAAMGYPIISHSLLLDENPVLTNPDNAIFGFIACGAGLIGLYFSASRPEGIQLRLVMTLFSVMAFYLGVTVLLAWGFS